MKRFKVVYFLIPLSFLFQSQLSGTSISMLVLQTKNQLIIILCILLLSINTYQLLDVLMLVWYDECVVRGAQGFDSHVVVTWVELSLATGHLQ